MNLRPYQQNALSGIASELQKVSSTLVCLPTGTGKTVCFASMIEQTRGRVMILAHRKELRG